MSSTQPPRPRPHVLILGAGLSGLTLAQALRKQGISSQIFERDSSLNSRFQGWAIALHKVLPDLRASIPDDLPPLETTSHLFPLDLPAQLCIYQGTNRTNTKAEGVTQLLRASRSRLRKLLATGLDIKWDMHMTSISETETAVTLHFADGTSATGDILVGCDGVNSPVRTHLLGPNLLQTLPIGCICGETTLTRAQYQRQMALGTSAFIAIPGSGSARLFVGLNALSADDAAATARYYWFFTWSDPAAAAATGAAAYWTKTAGKQEMYDFVVEKSGVLEERFTEILGLTQAEGVLQPGLLFRDLVLEGLPVGRVTLAGDAAHPMTPFRGQGGNEAMVDSLNLAKAIAKSDPGSLVAVLKEYRDEMLVRGALAVRASRAAAEDDGSGTRDAFERMD